MGYGNGTVHSPPAVARGGKGVNFVGCLNSSVKFGVRVGVRVLEVNVYGFPDEDISLVDSWALSSEFVVFGFVGVVFVSGVVGGFGCLQGVCGASWRCSRMKASAALCVWKSVASCRAHWMCCARPHALSPTTIPKILAPWQNCCIFVC